MNDDYMDEFCAEMIGEMRRAMHGKPEDQRPYYLLMQLHLIGVRLDATLVLLTEEVERVHGMTPGPDLPPGVIDFRKRRREKP